MSGAIIAHMQAGLASLPYGIYVDGLDVARQTPLDSITVTEAGPGGVSDMAFKIRDATDAIEIADGAVIRMHDLVRDMPVFTGFLESKAITPWAATGRDIDVRAYGIEALLDTIVNLTDVGPAPGPESWLLQRLCSYAPLRAFMPNFNWWPIITPSTQAKPIGGTGYRLWPTMSAVVAGGSSIRATFEQSIALIQGAPSVGDANVPAMFLTVDPWGGVRMFGWGGVVGLMDLPTDYATLTVVNTPAGAITTANLRYEEDHSPGAITNAVYVKGAAAASTGWVVGDTRTGRREGYTTTTGVTESDKQAAAQALLNTRGTPAGHGEFDLSHFTPINAHPGSKVVITDSRMPGGGWSAKTFLISEIGPKTFNADGTQDWHVSFFDPGNAPVAGKPSLGRDIRRLTRGTAS